jgi:SAM-dependent methyltransferase
MLTAPTSNPVSLGTVRSILVGSLAFSVRMSWLQFGAPAASPLEIEVMTPGDAGVASVFLVGDVTRLEVAGSFDLALDIGCLHSIPAAGRAAYAAGLAQVVRPGGTFLLYAFAPGGPAVGLTAEDVRSTFTATFEIVEVEQGKGRPSAWYTLFKR